MTKMMTEETPVKVLSLLGAAVVSMFFMAAVSVSGVTWSGNSGAAIADPFSPNNVMAFVDQAAWVYSDAVDAFLVNPAVSDFAFIPENLGWIAENAELALAVAVGLQDPLPQVSAPQRVQGQVAGATIYVPQYNDNIFSLYFGR